MFTLLIDGNYFAQRLRNSMKLNFIDNPENDRKLLFEGAATSLAYEIRSLEHVLEHVIICRDWSSWRKKLDQVVAEESLKSSEEQVYKSGRGKDVSYDSAAFYSAFDEFCNLCESKLQIPQIKSYGAEADDLVYILSQVYKKLGKQTIAWSSDGDYLQMVNDSTLLLKFPKRQLHIPIKENVEKQSISMMDVFSQKPMDRTSLLMKTFSSSDVVEVNPMKSAFQKIVSGDAKDDVSPIFFWTSNGKAKKTMRPAPGHYKKAFAKLGTGMTLETVTEEFMYDDKLIKIWLGHLIEATKQERDLEHTFKVYKSNRQMKMLSFKEIPNDISKASVEAWKLKKDLKAKIKISSNYQNILEQFNHIELKSFFNGFDLSDSQEKSTSPEKISPIAKSILDDLNMDIQ